MRSIVTSYNADGQITAIGDQDSQYAFAYDGQGRQTSVGNNGTFGAPQVLLTSQYDPLGDRSSLSAAVNGTPDFLDNYSYDTLQEMTAETQQGQTGGNAVATKGVSFEYDRIGDITSIQRYTNITQGPSPATDAADTSLGYNNLGQLTSENHTHNGTTLENLSWTFDTLDRVSTFKNNDDLASYGYDKASQVVSATYSGSSPPPNFSTTYDPNGVRNAAGDTVGPNNHLASDGTFDFTYDNEGNLVTRVRISSAAANDYKVLYDWDYRNRLTDAYFYDNSGTLTQQIHYVYDVFDHLIERDVDPTGAGTFTQIAHYVWDISSSAPMSAEDGAGSGSAMGAGEGGVVLEFNGQQQLTNRYLNGPNTSASDAFFSTLAEEAVSSTASPGTVTFDLLDNQGSVRNVVSASGALLDHMNYTVTGQVASESSPSTPHLTSFAGGFLDPATQMLNEYHRWLVLADGFWASQDPEGLGAGDPNFSRYVGNSGPNFIDPSGLEHLPSEKRGKWVKGTRGNGVFEYFDTPQNRADGLAGKQVKFKGGYIGLGGFPAEFYYGGNATSATVKIAEVKGNGSDFTAADRAMRTKLNDPNWQRPVGYTWNHAGKLGSKRMELVDEAFHSKVAHTGPASAPRAAARLAATNGCMARGVAALNVYMAFRDAAVAAGLTADQYEVNTYAEYYFVDEDGSVFTVHKPGWPTSMFMNSYRKFVAGPREGETERISSDAVAAYQKQAEDKWGRYIPGNLIRGPRFEPGTDRDTLPVVKNGMEIGYILLSAGPSGNFREFPGEVNSRTSRA